jgi:hypothetical protein
MVSSIFGKETKNYTCIFPMSHQSSQFGEIDIPALLLADMYPHSLVLIDQVESKRATKPASTEEIPLESSILAEPKIELSTENPAPTTLSPPIAKLGGFAKKILVLVNEENVLHISDHSLELLSKMLAAVQLSLADIALINLATQNIILQQIHQELDADIHIFFGVEPSSMGLPMRFPYFQIQNWNNKVFLYSPSLKELNGTAEEQTHQKRNLWASLKVIFRK